MSKHIVLIVDNNTDFVPDVIAKLHCVSLLKNYKAVKHGSIYVLVLVWIFRGDFDSIDHWLFIQRLRSRVIPSYLGFYIVSFSVNIFEQIEIQSQNFQAQVFMVS